MLESPTRQFDLLVRTLIGRSPSCDVLLADPSVSAEHAVIARHGDHWEIRDLGSRNGTVVDGKPLTGNGSSPLKRGTTLRFGLADTTWTLAEEGPPLPRAVRLSDGKVVAADGDLLAIPSPERAQAMLVRSEGRWVLEGESSTRAVRNREQLSLEGELWELRLPVVLRSTMAGADLRSVTLSFTVSRDEEHVSWSVLTGAREIELGDRVHTYLLLTLARARLADREAGEPTESQGWCVADDLARRLDLTPENLKVYVYRARQQLHAAGITGATSLVERRATSNQIRLGVDRIQVERV